MSRLSIIFATICYLLSFAQTAHAVATYPQWWETQGVVLEQPPPASGEPGYDPATYDAWMADNYAPANLGQAKHLSAAAFSTMEIGLTDSGISDMVSGFSTAPEDNYVPLLIGQLKFLAEPFYNQMHTVGFTVTLSDGTVIANGNYPWTPNTPVADNYAPANLGQLKHVFSFDLTDWPPNLYPIVDAGEDREILLPPGSLSLTGDAYDTDGPQTLVTTWTQQSGPGTAVFDDTSALTVSVDFPVVGTYVLRLEATDGEATEFDELTIEVKADTDGNGIDDAIDTAWAAVIAATPGFVSLTDADFYDPDGLITGDPGDPNDDLAFLPVEPADSAGYESIQWDYDGDGISNYQEYLNGTDPTDYFNGETPTLTIFWGNNQTVEPEAFSEKSLYVKIENATGTGYLNAPVRFGIDSGDNGQLSRLKSTGTLSSALTLRAIAAGASGYFYAPALASGTETTDVIASLPDGQSVTFTLTTDSSYTAPGRPPYDFYKKDNTDGTITYFWRKDSPSGNFNVRKEEPIRSGNWILLFSVAYASLDAPTDGNQYTVTVDANYTVIPST